MESRKPLAPTERRLSMAEAGAVEDGPIDPAEIGALAGAPDHRRQGSGLQIQPGVVAAGGLGRSRGWPDRLRPPPRNGAHWDDGQQEARIRCRRAGASQDVHQAGAIFGGRWRWWCHGNSHGMGPAIHEEQSTGEAIDLIRINHCHNGENVSKFKTFRKSVSVKKEVPRHRQFQGAENSRG